MSFSRACARPRFDPIPEETLWRILDSARWAPNHRLTEPWRIAGWVPLSRVSSPSSGGAEKTADPEFREKPSLRPRIDTNERE